MVAGEDPKQGESNFRAATADNIWGYNVSGGVSAEGDNVTYCVKDGVAKVCH